MIRVNGTCLNQGVDYQRFLENRAKKSTLMMIVDTGTEVHVVSAKHRKRLHDRATAGGSVPIEEMGGLTINAVTTDTCVVDPLATHSLFSVSLAEEDGWHYEQGGGQATLYQPQLNRRILLSKFGGLYVSENTSPMMALCSSGIEEDQDHGRRRAVLSHSEDDRR